MGRKVLGSFKVVFFFLFLNMCASAGSFELTIESIKDSSAILEKIKLPGDPLYPYFSKVNAPQTRADLISVINEQVLPNTGFSFEATQLDELKTTAGFESLGSVKQEEVLAKNRDFLTELYPDEIAPRNSELVKQGFGIRIDLIKPDSMLWLKAEMMNFLNEIIVNDRILGNWKNLRQFFDEKVADEEIETFTESMRTYNKKKIPVNSIDIEHRKSDQTADLLLKGKNDRAQKKLFAISTIPGKTWKILQIKDIDKALQKAGYIEKKEVRQ